MAVHIDEPVVIPDGANDALDQNQVLGTDTYRWTSTDKTVTVVYGRARGLASQKVARVLGPIQAANIVLTTFYMALLGIRTFNGEDYLEPHTELEFDAAMRRFGTDETMDANLNDYVIAWQTAMHPETREAMDQARAMGASPESLDRIAQNAGRQTAKKSRTRPS